MRRPSTCGDVGILATPRSRSHRTCEVQGAAYGSGQETKKLEAEQRKVQRDQDRTGKLLAYWERSTSQTA